MMITTIRTTAYPCPSGMEWNARAAAFGGLVASRRAVVLEESPG